MKGGLAHLQRRWTPRGQGCRLSEELAELCIGDVGGLQPLRLAQIPEEQIPAPEEGGSAGMVQNEPGFERFGHLQRDPGDQVGIDDPLHDLPTGALGGKDQMEAGCPSPGSQAGEAGPSISCRLWRFPSTRSAYSSQRHRRRGSGWAARAL